MPTLEEYGIGPNPDMTPPDMAAVRAATVRIRTALQENARAGRVVRGVSRADAELLARWAVHNTRLALQRGIETANEAMARTGQARTETIDTASLDGFCGKARSMLHYALQDLLGSHGHPVHSSMFVPEGAVAGNVYSHATYAMRLPIEEGGQITERSFLLDPTFRQFFFKGAAQVVGEHLLSQPDGQQIADKLLRDGFIELDKPTAEAFYRSTVKEPYRAAITHDRIIDLITHHDRRADVHGVFPHHEALGAGYNVRYPGQTEEEQRQAAIERRVQLETELKGIVSNAGSAADVRRGLADRSVEDIERGTYERRMEVRERLREMVVDLRVKEQAAAGGEVKPKWQIEHEVASGSENLRDLHQEVVRLSERASARQEAARQRVYGEVRDVIRQLPLHDRITQGDYRHPDYLGSTGSSARIGPCKPYTEDIVAALKEKMPGLQILAVENDNTPNGGWSNGNRARLSSNHAYILAYHPEVGHFMIDSSPGQFLGRTYHGTFGRGDKTPYNDVFIGTRAELETVMARHGMGATEFGMHWPPSVTPYADPKAVVDPHWTRAGVAVNPALSNVADIDVRLAAMMEWEGRRWPEILERKIADPHQRALAEIQIRARIPQVLGTTEGLAGLAHLSPERSDRAVARNEHVLLQQHRAVMRGEVPNPAAYAQEFDSWQDNWKTRAEEANTRTRADIEAVYDRNYFIAAERIKAAQAGVPFDEQAALAEHRRLAAGSPGAVRQHAQTTFSSVIADLQQRAGAIQYDTELLTAQGAVRGTAATRADALAAARRDMVISDADYVQHLQTQIAQLEAKLTEVRLAQPVPGPEVVLGRPPIQDAVAAERAALAAAQQNARRGRLVAGVTEAHADTLIKWMVDRARNAIYQHSTREGGGNGIGMDANPSRATHFLSNPFNTSLWSGFATEFMQTQGQMLSLRVQRQSIQTVSPHSTQGHGFAVVSVPVKGADGQVVMKDYLVDTTFRQFFDKSGYTTEIDGKPVTIESWAKRLVETPAGRALADGLLRDGFVELTPENARLYVESQLYTVDPHTGQARRATLTADPIALLRDQQNSHAREFTVTENVHSNNDLRTPSMVADGRPLDAMIARYDQMQAIQDGYYRGDMRVDVDTLLRQQPEGKGIWSVTSLDRTGGYSIQYSGSDINGTLPDEALKRLGINPELVRRELVEAGTESRPNSYKMIIPHDALPAHLQQFSGPHFTAAAPYVDIAARPVDPGIRPPDNPHLAGTYVTGQGSPFTRGSGGTGLAFSLYGLYGLHGKFQRGSHTMEALATGGWYNAYALGDITLSATNAGLGLVQSGAELRAGFTGSRSATALAASPWLARSLIGFTVADGAFEFGHGVIHGDPTLMATGTVKPTAALGSMWFLAGEQTLANSGAGVLRAAGLRGGALALGTGTGTIGIMLVAEGGVHLISNAIKDVVNIHRHIKPQQLTEFISSMPSDPRVLDQIIDPQLRAYAEKAQALLRLEQRLQEVKAKYPNNPYGMMYSLEYRGVRDAYAGVLHSLELQIRNQHRTTGFDENFITKAKGIYAQAAALQDTPYAVLDKTREVTEAEIDRFIAALPGDVSRIQQIKNPHLQQLAAQLEDYKDRYRDSNTLVRTLAGFVDVNTSLPAIRKEIAEYLARRSPDVIAHATHELAGLRGSPYALADARREVSDAELARFIETMPKDAAAIAQITDPRIRAFAERLLKQAAITPTELSSEVIATMAASVSVPLTEQSDKGLHQEIRDFLAKRGEVASVAAIEEAKMAAAKVQAAKLGIQLVQSDVRVMSPEAQLANLQRLKMMTDNPLIGSPLHMIQAGFTGIDIKDIPAISFSGATLITDPNIVAVRAKLEEAGRDHVDPGEKKVKAEVDAGDAPAHGLPIKQAQKDEDKQPPSQARA